MADFVVMKSKEREAVDLEAELLRLNALVRQRRKQLARLAECPNKDCECRAVWQEVVSKKLAGQIGKIRRHVRRPKAAKTQGSKQSAM